VLCSSVNMYYYTDQSIACELTRESFIVDVVQRFFDVDFFQNLVLFTRRENCKPKTSINTTFIPVGPINKFLVPVVGEVIFTLTRILPVSTTPFYNYMFYTMCTGRPKKLATAASANEIRFFVKTKCQSHCNIIKTYVTTHFEKLTTGNNVFIV